MFKWLSVVSDAAQPDARTAHADAVATVNRAAAEVTRLAALVQGATLALSAAEAGAADAVAAPASTTAVDLDVMATAVAARARRDAAITAHARAEALHAEAKAALPAHEREMRRLAVESELELLPAAFAELEHAIDLLGAAWPIVEQRYRSGTGALADIANERVQGFGNHVRAPSLLLASRVRALLFRRTGLDVFAELMPQQPLNLGLLTQPTLAESVEELVSGLRRRAGMVPTAG